MGKRKLQMMAVAMVLVMAAGMIGGSFENQGTISTISEVQAEETDTIYTTENRYYQYRILDKEKKTIEIVKGVEGGLVLEIVKGKAVLNIPSELEGYTVVSLGEKAFANMINVEVVNIPNTVTNIGKRCFYACTNLEMVNLTTSVTSFGENAFAFTPWLLTMRNATGNKMVIINDILIDGRACSGDVVVPDGVTRINDGAFYSALTINKKEQIAGSLITGITIPSSVKEIGDFAFCMNEHLKKVEFNSGLKSIGEQAFAGCLELETLDLPATVSWVAGGAFYKCGNLTTVDLTKTSLTDMTAYCFGDCTKLKSIELPKTVSSIWRVAFSGCTSLTEIKLSEAVTEIGKQAFSGCTSLTEIKLPEAVTEIGENAFEDGITFYVVAGSVMEAYMKKNNLPYKTYEIKKQEPSTEPTTEPSTTKPSTTKPSTTEPSTTKPSIPAKPSTTKPSTTKPSTTKPSTPKPSTTKKPSAKSLIGKTVKRRKLQYKILSTTSVSVKKPVKKTYKEIVIPKTIKYFGRTYKVIRIEDQAFKGCKQLKTVEIGSKVKKIGNSAFRDCPKLVNVVIGSNVTSIGNHAFRGCKKLKEIEIANHVKTIGESAFRDCTALTYITFGTRVETIGKSAFQNDKKIKEIEIKTKRLRKIGKKALRNTKKGKIIHVPVGKGEAYKKLIKAAK